LPGAGGLRYGLYSINGETIMAIHPAPAEFSAQQLRDDPVLRYFHYAHLPQPLQDISGAFCALAVLLVEALPRNPERSVALRKLLEAKDAGVRANLPPLPDHDAAPPVALVHDAGDRDEILETRVTGGGSVEEPIGFKDV
jgi:hypothetical protein